MACQTMAMMTETMTMGWSFHSTMTSRPAAKDKIELSIPFSGL